MKSLNFIGGGNMAQALIKGIAATGGDTAFHVAEPDAAARERLKEIGGVKTADDASELPASDATVIAVKPFHLADALSGWRPESQLAISVVAGARIPTLVKLTPPRTRIIRTMPNTPALFGKGMTGLYAPPEATEPDRTAAAQIFASVGKILWVEDEGKLDAVTAISGSGPAYIFRYFEALQQAAEELGLESADAKTALLQTFEGAVRMLADSGRTAAELREAVTSKRGATEAALAILNDHAIDDAMLAALKAAEERSRKIAEETEAATEQQ